MWGELKPLGRAKNGWTVENGGRIHFNLAEFDPEFESDAPQITASELEYVLGNPGLTNATTFYGGP